ncbi:MAG: carcinine hydrolase/isopenicillin-N N-acyltransferase family protein [Nitrospinales bacterium]
MKIIVNLFVFIFIAILMVPNTIACTIFTVSNGETVMFGGNEDQTPNSSFLVVDNGGTFGVVYFATPWKKKPLVMQMGINEMGLCYDGNWIAKEKLNPHPERKSQYEWAVTQLMRESSTVEEVLSKIFTYNWGDSIEYQIHFADKSGDAAVIHPKINGELTYTRKSKGNGYLISTNFNLAKLDKGNWSSSYSSNRYKTADKMLLTIGAQNDLTVEFMASVLKATHRRYGRLKTLYSAVYDLQNLHINLYYDRQFDAPYVLDVKKELAKTTFRRKVTLMDLISNKDLNKKKN